MKRLLEFNNGDFTEQYIYCRRNVTDSLIEAPVSKASKYLQRAADLKVQAAVNRSQQQSITDSPNQSQYIAVDRSRSRAEELAGTSYLPAESFTRATAATATDPRTVQVFRRNPWSGLNHSTLNEDITMTTRKLPMKMKEPDMEFTRKEMAQIAAGRAADIAPDPIPRFGTIGPVRDPLGATTSGPVLRSTADFALPGSGGVRIFVGA